jgi:hypothetical protein
MNLLCKFVVRVGRKLTCASHLEGVWYFSCTLCAKLEHSDSLGPTRLMLFTKAKIVRELPPISLYLNVNDGSKK